MLFWKFHCIMFDLCICCTIIEPEAKLIAVKNSMVKIDNLIKIKSNKNSIERKMLKKKKTRSSKCFKRQQFLCFSSLYGRSNQLFIKTIWRSVHVINMVLIMILIRDQYVMYGLNIWAVSHIEFNMSLLWCMV